MAEKEIIPFSQIGLKGRITGYCDGEGIQAPSRFKMLKKKHMNFTTVRSALAAEAKAYLEQSGDKVPEDCDALAYMIVREATSMAMMPLQDDRHTFTCNTCKKESRFICEHCGENNTIKADNVNLLKAKSPYINKLLDKLAPNLQTSEVNVKIDVVMSRFSTLIVEMINSDIPDQRRQHWLKKFDGACSELIESVKADE